MEFIAYTIGDGRKVERSAFHPLGNETRIVETFEAENTHSIEMQRGGWQAILDNFKKICGIECLNIRIESSIIRIECTMNKNTLK